MKILILQGAFLPVPPIMGGAVEKMWFLLGQKFYERGHTVIHVSRQYLNFSLDEVINGVQHIRIKGYKMPQNTLILKFLDALYTFHAIKVIPQDIDIIITNTFWAPIIVPFFKTAKIYVDVARMPKGQMKFYGKATRLRANSTAVYQAICAELPPVEHNRTVMIPNPLPYTRFPKVDFRKKKRIILYCGRIHPEKGLDLLGETIRILPEQWEIRIFGPWKISEGGAGETYLTQLRQKLGTKVLFFEPVYDTDKLNKIYSEASIFIYPSIADKGETFGLSILEAMACGCVPVVSDLLCFKDFVYDYDNALIFNHRCENAELLLASCINRLISNPYLREKLARSALEVRKSHSIENISNLFIQDFMEIFK